MELLNVSLSLVADKRPLYLNDLFSQTFASLSSFSSQKSNFTLLYCELPHAILTSPKVCKLLVSEPSTQGVTIWILIDPTSILAVRVMSERLSRAHELDWLLSVLGSDPVLCSTRN